MSQKPAWLTRKIVLQIALAVIAAGLFGPLYTVVEQTIGKDRAAELLQWGISAKDETEAAVTNAPVPTPPTVPEVPPVPVSVDELDISGAIQVCSNPANNLRNLSAIPANHRMISAQVQGSNVRVAYDIPSSYWSSTSDHLGFARGFVFWQDGGQVYASHYDWFKPGQTVKTLGNLYNGYVTRKPTGTLYFALISNDGKQRTNVKAAR